MVGGSGYLEDKCSREECVETADQTHLTKDLGGGVRVRVKLNGVYVEIISQGLS